MPRKKKFHSHYKIRQLTFGNKTGEAFGINVPTYVAMNFLDVYFSVKTSGNSIIYSSGACPFKKERGEYW
jgi:hypothetical protein